MSSIKRPLSQDPGMGQEGPSRPEKRDRTEERRAERETRSERRKKARRESRDREKRDIRRRRREWSGQRNYQTPKKGSFHSYLRH